MVPCKKLLVQWFWIFSTRVILFSLNTVNYPSLLNKTLVTWAPISTHALKSSLTLTKLQNYLFLLKIWLIRTLPLFFILFIYFFGGEGVLKNVWLLPATYKYPEKWTIFVGWEWRSALMGYTQEADSQHHIDVPEVNMNVQKADNRTTTHNKMDRTQKVFFFTLLWNSAPWINQGRISNIFLQT